MSFDLKLTNGDLSLSNSGEVETVFNVDKLTQDILKIIFTPTNSHILHKWYGSPLSARVGGKVYPQDILESEIQNSVLYALKNLKTLQDLQQKDGQFVSPQEAITKVQDITVNLDSADPRQVFINIRVMTKSGAIVEESFSITR